MTSPGPQRFPWNLDWNLLRTFMVVVEKRGISKAADVLGLKQPTVSAALKRLEATVGKTLIIRKPNEFSVTRAGQVLYTQSATIFGAVSQLPELMDVAGDTLRGHIAISTTSHVMSDHFDAFLNRFAATHPKITYGFQVLESHDVETMIAQNRASLGICLLSRIPDRLTAEVLYKEYFGLYCGPRHRLFNTDHIGTEDLADEPFVAFQTEAEGGPLEAISHLRARMGMSSNWRGVSSNLTEIRRMIMAGIGIGALPVHVAARDVAAGSLHQLPPLDGLPEVSIYIITNPDRRLSEAEHSFLHELRQSLAETNLSERTYGTD
ncbi:LysR family transcriptional regulator [Palleronia caenipelagi]|uniref:LysR family transcriptional regulator n=1 Tax=Palleronia caenipelagi TaxID=2489174 RepID=A0A547PPD0_9RHOB|nr:LysR family transcriptional regulator [Palleronia caenipelagi]TRD15985.1 LysR family transcriptional regulator [Palleronia caenipelagi]